MRSKKRLVTEDDQSESDETKSLHDMITDALLGIGSSGMNSPHFIGTGVTPDMECGNVDNFDKNLENSNLTLEELFMKFQNLDSRLCLIEKMIAKQDIDIAVKKRVTTLRSRYSGAFDPCLSPSNNSMTCFNTIDPILTNGTDNMSMNSESNSCYSLPPPTFSNNVQRKDEIKRYELDNYCLPLLTCDPKPTTEKLQEIVYSVSPLYPDLPNKQLLSKVREWFRKRREYMSQRIFLSCAAIFEDLTIETETELEAQIIKLNQNNSIVSSVLKTADLEIIDPIVAQEYCKEKILSYFNSLYKPSSLKSRTYK